MDFKKVKKMIDSCYAVGDTFTTVELIRKLEHEYKAAHGMSAAESPNSQFGRDISLARDQLGIEAVKKRMSVVDDDGRPTTTALWKVK